MTDPDPYASNTPLPNYNGKGLVLAGRKIYQDLAPLRNAAAEFRKYAASIQTLTDDVDKLVKDGLHGQWEGPAYAQFIRQWAANITGNGNDIGYGLPVNGHTRAYIAQMQDSEEAVLPLLASHAIDIAGQLETMAKQLEDYLIARLTSQQVEFDIAALAIAAGIVTVELGGIGAIAVEGVGGLLAGMAVSAATFAAIDGLSQLANMAIMNPVLQAQGDKPIDFNWAEFGVAAGVGAVTGLVGWGAGQVLKGPMQYWNPILRQVISRGTGAAVGAFSDGLMQLGRPLFDPNAKPYQFNPVELGQSALLGGLMGGRVMDLFSARPTLTIDAPGYERIYATPRDETVFGVGKNGRLVDPLTNETKPVDLTNLGDYSGGKPVFDLRNPKTGDPIGTVRLDFSNPDNPRMLVESNGKITDLPLNGTKVQSFGTAKIPDPMDGPAGRPMNYQKSISYDFSDGKLVPRAQIETSNGNHTQISKIEGDGTVKPVQFHDRLTSDQFVDLKTGMPVDPRSGDPVNVAGQLKLPKGSLWARIPLGDNPDGPVVAAIRQAEHLPPEAGSAPAGALDLFTAPNGGHLEHTGWVAKAPGDDHFNFYKANPASDARSIPGESGSQTVISDGMQRFSFNAKSGATELSVPTPAERGAVGQQKLTFTDQHGQKLAALKNEGDGSFTVFSTGPEGRYVGTGTVNGTNFEVRLTDGGRPFSVDVSDTPLAEAAPPPTGPPPGEPNAGAVHPVQPSDGTTRPVEVTKPGSNVTVAEWNGARRVSFEDSGRKLVGLENKDGNWKIFDPAGDGPGRLGTGKLDGTDFKVTMDDGGKSFSVDVSGTPLDPANGHPATGLSDSPPSHPYQPDSSETPGLNDAKGPGDAGQSSPESTENPRQAASPSPTQPGTQPETQPKPTSSPAAVMDRPLENPPTKVPPSTDGPPGSTGAEDQGPKVPRLPDLPAKPGEAPPPPKNSVGATPVLPMVVRPGVGPIVPGDMTGSSVPIRPVQSVQPPVLGDLPKVPLQAPRLQVPGPTPSALAPGQSPSAPVQTPLAPAQSGPPRPGAADPSRSVSPISPDGSAPPAQSGQAPSPAVRPATGGLRVQPQGSPQGTAGPAGNLASPAPVSDPSARPGLRTGAQTGGGASLGDAPAPIKIPKPIDAPSSPPVSRPAVRPPATATPAGSGDGVGSAAGGDRPVVAGGGTGTHAAPGTGRTELRTGAPTLNGGDSPVKSGPSVAVGDFPAIASGDADAPTAPAPVRTGLHPAAGGGPVNDARTADLPGAVALSVVAPTMSSAFTIAIGSVVTPPSGSPQPVGNPAMPVGVPHVVPGGTPGEVRLPGHRSNLTVKPHKWGVRYVWRMGEFVQQFLLDDEVYFEIQLTDNFPDVTKAPWGPLETAPGVHTAYKWVWADKAKTALYLLKNTNNTIFEYTRVDVDWAKEQELEFGWFLKSDGIPVLTKPARLEKLADLSAESKKALESAEEAYQKAVQDNRSGGFAGHVAIEHAVRAMAAAKATFAKADGEYQAVLNAEERRILDYSDQGEPWSMTFLGDELVSMRRLQASKLRAHEVTVPTDGAEHPAADLDVAKRLVQSGFTVEVRRPEGSETGTEFVVQGERYLLYRPEEGELAAVITGRLQRRYGKKDDALNVIVDLSGSHLDTAVTGRLLLTGDAQQMPKATIVVGREGRAYFGAARSLPRQPGQIPRYPTPAELAKAKEEVAAIHADQKFAEASLSQVLTMLAGKPAASSDAQAVRARHPYHTTFVYPYQELVYPSVRPNDVPRKRGGKAQDADHVPALLAEVFVGTNDLNIVEDEIRGLLPSIKAYTVAFDVELLLSLRAEPDGIRIIISRSTVGESSSHLDISDRVRGYKDALPILHSHGRLSIAAASGTDRGSTAASGLPYGFVIGPVSPGSDDWVVARYGQKLLSSLQRPGPLADFALGMGIRKILTERMSQATDQEIGRTLSAPGPLFASEQWNAKDHSADGQHRDPRPSQDGRRRKESTTVHWRYEAPGDAYALYLLYNRDSPGEFMKWGIARYRDGNDNLAPGRRYPGGVLDKDKNISVEMFVVKTFKNEPTAKALERFLIENWAGPYNHELFAGNRRPWGRLGELVHKPWLGDRDHQTLEAVGRIVDGHALQAYRQEYARTSRKPPMLEQAIHELEAEQNAGPHGSPGGTVGMSGQPDKWRAPLDEVNRIARELYRQRRKISQAAVDRQVVELLNALGRLTDSQWRKSIQDALRTFRRTLPQGLSKVLHSARHDPISVDQGKTLGKILSQIVPDLVPVTMPLSEKMLELAGQTDIATEKSLPIGVAHNGPDDGFAGLIDFVRNADGRVQLAPDVAAPLDALLGFEHSGVTLSVVHAQTAGAGELEVYGSFLTPGGVMAGALGISFGVGVVPHIELDTLHLEPDYRGRSIAGEVFLRLRGLARRIGVAEIGLQAGEEMGGFVWPYKYGADFDTRLPYEGTALPDAPLSGVPEIIRHFEAHVGEMSDGVRAEWERLAPRATAAAWDAGDHVSAYELATLGIDEAWVEAGRWIWFGQLMMLGTRWHGVVRLDVVVPTTPGREVPVAPLDYSDRLRREIVELEPSMVKVLSDRPHVPGSFYLSPDEFEYYARELIRRMYLTKQYTGEGGALLVKPATVTEYAAVALVNSTGTSAVVPPSGWLVLMHYHPYGHATSAVPSIFDLLHVRQAGFDYFYVIHHAASNRAARALILRVLPEYPAGEQNWPSEQSGELSRLRPRVREKNWPNDPINEMRSPGVPTEFSAALVAYHEMAIIRDAVNELLEPIKDQLESGNVEITWGMVPTLVSRLKEKLTSVGRAKEALDVLQDFAARFTDRPSSDLLSIEELGDLWMSGESAATLARRAADAAQLVVIMTDPATAYAAEDAVDYLTWLNDGPASRRISEAIREDEITFAGNREEGGLVHDVLVTSVRYALTHLRLYLAQNPLERQDLIEPVERYHQNWDAVEAALDAVYLHRLRPEGRVVALATDDQFELVDEVLRTLFQWDIELNIWRERELPRLPKFRPESIVTHPVPPDLTTAFESSTGDAAPRNVTARQADSPRAPGYPSAPPPVFDQGMGRGAKLSLSAENIQRAIGLILPVLGGERPAGDLGAFAVELRSAFGKINEAQRHPHRPLSLLADDFAALSEARPDEVRNLAKAIAGKLVKATVEGGEDADIVALQRILGTRLALEQQLDELRARHARLEEELRQEQQAIDEQAVAEAARIEERFAEQKTRVFGQAAQDTRIPDAIRTEQRTINEAIDQYEAALRAAGLTPEEIAELNVANPPEVTPASATGPEAEPPSPVTPPSAPAPVSPPAPAPDAAPTPAPEPASPPSPAPAPRPARRSRTGKTSGPVVRPRRVKFFTDVNTPTPSAGTTSRSTLPSAPTPQDDLDYSPTGLAAKVAVQEAALAAIARADEARSAQSAPLRAITNAIAFWAKVIEARQRHIDAMRSHLAAFDDEARSLPGVDQRFLGKKAAIENRVRSMDVWAELAAHDLEDLKFLERVVEWGRRKGTVSPEVLAEVDRVFGDFLPVKDISDEIVEQLPQALRDELFDVRPFVLDALRVHEFMKRRGIESVVGGGIDPLHTELRDRSMELDGEIGKLNGRLAEHDVALSAARRAADAAAVRAIESERVRLEGELAAALDERHRLDRLDRFYLLRHPKWLAGEAASTQALAANLEQLLAEAVRRGDGANIPALAEPLTRAYERLRWLAAAPLRSRLIDVTDQIARLAPRPGQQPANARDRRLQPVYAERKRLQDSINKVDAVQRNVVAGRGLLERYPRLQEARSGLEGAPATGSADATSAVARKRVSLDQRLARVEDALQALLSELTGLGYSHPALDRAMTGEIEAIGDVLDERHLIEWLRRQSAWVGAADLHHPDPLPLDTRDPIVREIYRDWGRMSRKLRKIERLEHKEQELLGHEPVVRALNIIVPEPIHPHRAAKVREKIKKLDRKLPDPEPFQSYDTYIRELESGKHRGLDAVRRELAEDAPAAPQWNTVSVDVVSRRIDEYARPDRQRRADLAYERTRRETYVGRLNEMLEVTRRLQELQAHAAPADEIQAQSRKVGTARIGLLGWSTTGPDALPVFRRFDGSDAFPRSRRGSDPRDWPGVKKVRLPVDPAWALHRVNRHSWNPLGGRLPIKSETLEEVWDIDGHRVKVFKESTLDIDSGPFGLSMVRLGGNPFPNLWRSLTFPHLEKGRNYLFSLPLGHFALGFNFFGGPNTDLQGIPGLVRNFHSKVTGWKVKVTGEESWEFFIPNDDSEPSEPLYTVQYYAKTSPIQYQVGVSATLGWRANPADPPDQAMPVVSGGLLALGQGTSEHTIDPGVQKSQGYSFEALLGAWVSVPRAFGGHEWVPSISTWTPDINWQPGFSSVPWNYVLSLEALPYIRWVFDRATLLVPGTRRWTQERLEAADRRDYLRDAVPWSHDMHAHLLSAALRGEIPSVANGPVLQQQQPRKHTRRRPGQPVPSPTDASQGPTPADDSEVIVVRQTHAAQLPPPLPGWPKVMSAPEEMQVSWGHWPPDQEPGSGGPEDGARLVPPLSGSQNRTPRAPRARASGRSVARRTGIPRKVRLVSPPVRPAVASEVSPKPAGDSPIVAVPLVGGRGGEARIEWLLEVTRSLARPLAPASPIPSRPDGSPLEPALAQVLDEVSRSMADLRAGLENLARIVDTITPAAWTTRDDHGLTQRHPYLSAREKSDLRRDLSQAINLAGRLRDAYAEAHRSYELTVAAVRKGEGWRVPAAWHHRFPPALNRAVSAQWPRFGHLLDAMGSGASPAQVSGALRRLVDELDPAAAAATVPDLAGAADVLNHALAGSTDATRAFVEAIERVRRVLAVLADPAGLAQVFDALRGNAAVEDALDLVARWAGEPASTERSAALRRARDAFVLAAETPGAPVRELLRARDAAQSLAEPAAVAQAAYDELRLAMEIAADERDPRELVRGLRPRLRGLIRLRQRLTDVAWALAPVADVTQLAEQTETIARTERELSDLKAANPRLEDAHRMVVAYQKWLGRLAQAAANAGARAAALRSEVPPLSALRQTVRTELQTYDNLDFQAKEVAAWWQGLEPGERAAVLDPVIDALRQAGLPDDRMGAVEAAVRHDAFAAARPHWRPEPRHQANARRQAIRKRLKSLKEELRGRPDPIRRAAIEREIASLRVEQHEIGSWIHGLDRQTLTMAQALRREALKARADKSLTSLIDGLALVSRRFTADEAALNLHRARTGAHTTATEVATRAGLVDLFEDVTEVANDLIGLAELAVTPADDAIAHEAALTYAESAAQGLAEILIDQLLPAIREWQDARLAGDPDQGAMRRLDTAIGDVHARLGDVLFRVSLHDARLNGAPERAAADYARTVDAIVDSPVWETGAVRTDLNEASVRGLPSGPQAVAAELVRAVTVAFADLTALRTVADELASRAGREGDHLRALRTLSAVAGTAATLHAEAARVPATIHALVDSYDPATPGTTAPALREIRSSLERISSLTAAVRAAMLSIGDHLTTTGLSARVNALKTEIIGNEKRAHAAVADMMSLRAGLLSGGPAQGWEALLLGELGQALGDVNELAAQVGWLAEHLAEPARRFEVAGPRRPRGPLSVSAGGIPVRADATVGKFQRAAGYTSDAIEALRAVQWATQQVLDDIRAGRWAQARAGIATVNKATSALRELLSDPTRMKDVRRAAGVADRLTLRGPVAIEDLDAATGHAAQLATAAAEAKKTLTELDAGPYGKRIAELTKAIEDAQAKQDEILATDPASPFFDPLTLLDDGARVVAVRYLPVGGWRREHFALVPREGEFGHPWVRRVLDHPADLVRAAFSMDRRKVEPYGRFEYVIEDVHGVRYTIRVDEQGIIEDRGAWGRDVNEDQWAKAPSVSIPVAPGVTFKVAPGEGRAAYFVPVSRRRWEWKRRILHAALAGLPVTWRSVHDSVPRYVHTPAAVHETRQMVRSKAAVQLNWTHWAFTNFQVAITKTLGSQHELGDLARIRDFREVVYHLVNGGAEKDGLQVELSFTPLRIKALPEELVHFVPPFLLSKVNDLTYLRVGEMKIMYDGPAAQNLLIALAELIHGGALLGPDPLPRNRMVAPKVVSALQRMFINPYDFATALTTQQKSSVRLDATDWRLTRLRGHVANALKLLGRGTGRVAMEMHWHTGGIRRNGRMLGGATADGRLSEANAIEIQRLAGEAHKIAKELTGWVRAAPGGDAFTEFDAKKAAMRTLLEQIRDLLPPPPAPPAERISQGASTPPTGSAAPTTAPAPAPATSNQASPALQPNQAHVPPTAQVTEAVQPAVQVPPPSATPAVPANPASAAAVRKVAANPVPKRAPAPPGQIPADVAHLIRSEAAEFARRAGKRLAEAPGPDALFPVEAEEIEALIGQITRFAQSGPGPISAAEVSAHAGVKWTLLNKLNELPVRAGPRTTPMGGRTPAPSLSEPSRALSRASIPGKLRMTSLVPVDDNKPNAGESTAVAPPSGSGEIESPPVTGTVLFPVAPSGHPHSAPWVVVRRALERIFGGTTPTGPPPNATVADLKDLQTPDTNSSEMSIRKGQAVSRLSDKKLLRSVFVPKNGAYITIVRDIVYGRAHLAVRDGNHRVRELLDRAERPGSGITGETPLYVRRTGNWDVDGGPVAGSEGPGSDLSERADPPVPHIGSSEARPVSEPTVPPEALGRALPSGFAFLSEPDDELWAPYVPGSSRFFTLLAHFDETSGALRAGGRLRDSREVAELLPSLGWDGTKPLLVVGCGSATMAMGLRDLLTKDVLAADGDVVQADGRTIVGEVVVGDDARPSVVASGNWWMFPAAGGPDAKLGPELAEVLARFGGVDLAPEAGTAPAGLYRWGPRWWAPNRRRAGDVLKEVGPDGVTRTVPAVVDHRLAGLREKFKGRGWPERQAARIAATLQPEGVPGLRELLSNLDDPRWEHPAVWAWLRDVLAFSDPANDLSVDLLESKDLSRSQYFIVNVKGAKGRDASGTVVEATLHVRQGGEEIGEFELEVRLAKVVPDKKAPRLSAALEWSPSQRNDGRMTPLLVPLARHVEDFLIGQGVEKVVLSTDHLVDWVRDEGYGFDRATEGVRKLVSDLIGSGVFSLEGVLDWNLLSAGQVSAWELLNVGRRPGMTDWDGLRFFTSHSVDVGKSLLPPPPAEPAAGPERHSRPGGKAAPVRWPWIPPQARPKDEPPGSFRSVPALSAGPVPADAWTTPAPAAVAHGVSAAKTSDSPASETPSASAEERLAGLRARAGELLADDRPVQDRVADITALADGLADLPLTGDQAIYGSDLVAELRTVVKLASVHPNDELRTMLRRALTAFADEDLRPPRMHRPPRPVLSKEKPGGQDNVVDRTYFEDQLHRAGYDTGLAPEVPAEALRALRPTGPQASLDTPRSADLDRLAGDLREALRPRHVDGGDLLARLNELHQDPAAVHRLTEAYRHLTGCDLRTDILQVWYEGSLGFNPAPYLDHLLPEPATAQRLRNAAAATKPRDPVFVEGVHDAIVAGDAPRVSELLNRMDRMTEKNYALQDDYLRRYQTDLIAHVRDRFGRSAEGDYLSHLLGEGHLETRVLSVAEVKDLYQRLSKGTFRTLGGTKARIPFGHPEDGCADRAHLMAVKLSEWGYSSRKIFVIRWGPSAALRVQAETAQGASRGRPGAIGWRYHVAPVVEVRQPDDRVHEVVIDPSLRRGALGVDEWLGLMELNRSDYVRFDTTGQLPAPIQKMIDSLVNLGTLKSDTGLVFTTPREQYWPHQADLFSFRDTDQNAKEQEQRARMEEHARISEARELGNRIAQAAITYGYRTAQAAKAIAYIVRHDPAFRMLLDDVRAGRSWPPDILDKSGMRNQARRASIAKQAYDILTSREGPGHRPPGRPSE